MDNLVLLDREKFKPLTHGVVTAGLVMDNDLKWKVGEAEFESHMRMLDNLVSEPWPVTSTHHAEFPASASSSGSVRLENSMKLHVVWV